MNYELHYLPMGERAEDGSLSASSEMRAKIRHENHLPTGEEIEDLWEKQTKGEIDEESIDSPEEALGHLWEAYNRGPGGYKPEMDEKEMRSLSVGDIVVVDGDKWLCKPIGWENLDDGGDGS